MPVVRPDPAGFRLARRRLRYYKPDAKKPSGKSAAGTDASMAAWTNEFYETLQPYADEGVYVNLLGEDEDKRIPEAYGPNYERLAKLKSEWDPDAALRSASPVAPRAASS